MTSDLHAPWRTQSLCAATIKDQPFMQGAWDSPNEDGDRHPFFEEAKKLCLSCPVRNACLQDALDDTEADGTRGGYEFDNGRLPVAKAREIRDTTDLVLGEHQSTGRPKV